jgi:hypothetical protein
VEKGELPVEGFIPGRNQRLTGPRIWGLEKTVS